MKQLLFLFLLVILSSITLGQELLAKKINFHIDAEPISEALDQLVKQTSIDISYSKNFFRNHKPITLHLVDIPIKGVLDKILEGTTVNYKTLGENRVLLFKEKNKRLAVSGFVMDAETGERIVGAKVYSKVSRTGAITNEYGFFTFQLPKGEVSFAVSSVGYQAKLISTNTNVKNSISIKMNQLDDLPEVVVDGRESTNGLTYTSIATDQDNITEISPRLVSTIPSLNGTADFIRAAQLLPGVQGNWDGFSGMNIRGGESGQNLMLMDGSPIYIPYHLLGLYSTYNPTTIKSMRIVKGNFPSRYGGAVSSILDVRIREGDLYKWKGSADVNLVNAGITIEGPIKKGKGSILFAARYSPRAYFFEPALSRLYFESEVDFLKTSFYDMNIKTNYTISKKDHIYFSFFSGSDLIFQYAFTEIDPIETKFSSFDLAWSNTVGSFRWNHLFNKKLFSNTTLTYSKYGHRFSSQDEFETRSETQTISELFLIDNRSTNVDLGFKTDFDYNIANKHTLRFGVNYNYRNFIPNLFFSQNSNFSAGDGSPKIDSSIYNFNAYYDSISIPNYFIHETAMYVEDHIKFGAWYMNFGVRLSTFFHENSNYINLEPRLITKYRVNEKIITSLSVNRRIQYLHLISNPSIQLPNDLWIPSSDQTKPQELYEAEITLQYRPIPFLKLNATAYHRTTNNIYSYPETSEFLLNINDSKSFDYLIRGKGKSSGIEFFADYANEQRGLLFTYHISKATRQFDEINLGREFVSNFDSRHQVKFAFHQSITSSFRFSCSWIYNSPRPQINVFQFTASDGVFANIDEDPIGQKNTTRSLAYNRFDINMRFDRKLKKTHHFVEAGVYNVFNNENIAYHEITFLNSSTGEKDSKGLRSLPILPSISYRVLF